MRLLKGKTELSLDTREIAGAYWPVEGTEGFTVGVNGVTRIEAYDENGQMAMVPWVAVFKGDQICCRAPAAQMSVHYKMPDTF